MCFTFPALLNPGKVCVVVEPLVAIINNQVESLVKKGIDGLALGGAVESKKRSPNFRRVFRSSSPPNLAVCTPEYLFGALSNDVFQAQAVNSICFWK